MSFPPWPKLVEANPEILTNRCIHRQGKWDRVVHKIVFRAPVSSPWRRSGMLFPGYHADKASWYAAPKVRKLRIWHLLYISLDYSQFPPHMWSQYSFTISRTTNACESFHSHLNALFYSAHPNIFVLIDLLLEVQCDAYTKIIDITKQKSGANAVKKEAQVVTLMSRRDLGELSRLDLVRCVSFKFLPAGLKRWLPPSQGS